MLERIFPRYYDNSYRGHWGAIVLLVPILLLRLIIGGNSAWHPSYVASSADGVPLDLYPPAAAETVISMYATVGLYLLLFGLLGVLILIRYRAMIPLMFLLLIGEQVSGTVLNHLHPIKGSGAASAGAGYAVVFAILCMTLLGFGLSLLHNSKSG